MERKLNLYKKRMIEHSAKIIADIITTLIMYNILSFALFLQTKTYTPLHTLYNQWLQNCIQNKDIIIQSFEHMITYGLQFILYHTCFLSSLAYSFHAICYIALLIVYIHEYTKVRTRFKQSTERNTSNHE